CAILTVGTCCNLIDCRWTKSRTVGDPVGGVLMVALTRLAGRLDHSHSRFAHRLELHLCGGPEIGRLSHRARRSDVARRHSDWRAGIDTLGGAAVYRKADRAGQYFRGPSRYRDRERAAVRRNPGQEPTAATRERA